MIYVLFIMSFVGLEPAELRKFLNCKFHSFVRSDANNNSHAFHEKKGRFSTVKILWVASSGVTIRIYSARTYAAQLWVTPRAAVGYTYPGH